MTSYHLLTHYFYKGHNRFTDLDFRLKNIAIYVGSDFMASFSKIWFETRKQMIQMCQYQRPLSEISKNSYLGWFALSSRDVLFRTVLLSFYYSTTEVEHKPTLKHSIPELMQYQKYLKAQGHDYTVQDIVGDFYEHHNYHVKTLFTTRITLMLLGNLLATLVTNPIDVCLSKILT
jgi:hypothetical protein